MEVSLLANELRAWDDYVMSHPTACNYHLTSWRTVLEQSFGHTTRYLLAKKWSRIVGILPLVVMKSLLFGRFVVSLPFFNYGGILANDQDVEEALLTSAQAVTREERAVHLELRHRFPHGLGLRAKRHKVTMILELATMVEDQWKSFDPKLRNQIRKAEKSNLWMQTGGEELVEAFYAVFARNMRDLGTPVYSIEFFEAILRSFPYSTKIFVVRLHEQPIAAGLVCAFKENMEMPWAGSVREYRNLCGNMLLYWEAIKFAIEQGFRRFDFGRSTPGGSTFKFKEQWGGRPLPLAWEYWTVGAQDLPNVSPANPKYEVPIRIWKRLPIRVANFLGPFIARTLP